MSQQKIQRVTLQILLIGLIARLLVMPFSAHSDLMQFYWNAHLLTYHQKLVGFQVVLRYLHAGYLWLVTWLLPHVDSLWIHLEDDPFLNPFAIQGTSSMQGWLDFVSQPKVFRTLFLLKLPYLLFDLGCAFLLLRLGSNRASSRRMFTFWWLNPILIFAVYVFGRYEVVALFFIILSLYWIKKEKQIWGLLAIGLAIAIRYYALLLLPIWVFSTRTRWKDRIIGLMIGLAPWFVVNVIGWIMVGSIEGISLSNLPHDNYLLSMKFQIADWDNVYIFPLAYFLLLLHQLYNREDGMQSMVKYGLIAFLLLFATAYSGQSPHYWTWFLPLLTIAVAEKSYLLPLHVAQIVCLVVYSFIGGRSTAGYLFAPISPELFWSLPSPVEVLARFVSPEIAISLFRTAFSALSLWMAYLVFRRIKFDFIFKSDADGA